MRGDWGKDHNGARRIIFQRNVFYPHTFIMRIKYNKFFNTALYTRVFSVRRSRYDYLYIYIYIYILTMPQRFVDKLITIRFDRELMNSTTTQVITLISVSTYKIIIYLHHRMLRVLYIHTYVVLQL